MAPRAHLPGLGALAALVLLIAALIFRRFRLGIFLFHVAVALGERWRELRERGRVAARIAASSIRPESADRAA